MRVLITAGPTREYIDDVRFISNPSSGGMGVALAEEADRRGFEVTLVLGPTSVTPLYGMKVIPVVSSQEMTDKTLAELADGYDVLISAAALADYTPEKKEDGKIRSGSELTLKLKPTRKLIKEARALYPGLKIVAFKAEYDKTDDELVEAAKGLLSHADVVVANDVSFGVFGADDTQAIIVSADGRVTHIEKCSKKDAARRVLDAVC
jgi:phosphopantothenoylcysteine decarboxylase/phosphopantothenate--cysteine ligase